MFRDFARTFDCWNPMNLSISGGSWLLQVSLAKILCDTQENTHRITQHFIDNKYSEDRIIVMPAIHFIRHSYAKDKEQYIDLYIIQSKE